MINYPSKRTKTIEVDVCQGCGGDASYENCLNCGDKFCYDCAKTQLSDFRYSLHFSGSYNGNYCNICADSLLQKKDPLRLKYERMEELCAKSKAFYDRLNAEAEILSKEIEVMRQNMRNK